MIVLSLYYLLTVKIIEEILKDLFENLLDNNVHKCL